MYDEGRVSLKGSVGTIVMDRHPGRLGEIVTPTVQSLYT